MCASITGCGCMWTLLCGAALLPRTHRHLLLASRGLTLAWNPHKLLCTSQQCSALLLRAPRTCLLLSRVPGQLPLPAGQVHVALDRGDKVGAVWPAVTGLKLWLMWAAGVVGLARTRPLPLPGTWWRS